MVIYWKLTFGVYRREKYWKFSLATHKRTVFLINRFGFFFSFFPSLPIFIICFFFFFFWGCENNHHGMEEFEFHNFFFLESTKTNPYKDINLGLITSSKENCTWWPKIRSWKIRKYTTYMRQWICSGQSGLRIRNPILSPKDAPLTKTSSRIIPISLVNRRFYAMQICIVSGRR